MRWALLTKANAFQSFTQFFNCCLACYAVNTQTSFCLVGFDRGCGFAAENAIESACVVAMTNEQALKDFDVIALCSLFQVADGVIGLLSENAVNGKLCAVLLVEHGLQCLDKCVFGLASV